MAEIRIIHRVEVDDGTRVYSLGDLTPVSVSITGLPFCQGYSIATATTTKVFDIDEDLASFKCLWILSTQDVFMELVVDDDNDVGEVSSAHKLRANVIHTVGHDDAKANYTVNFAAGSDDNIETVRIRNESGSTATVVVLAAL